MASDSGQRQFKLSSWTATRSTGTGALGTEGRDFNLPACEPLSGSYRDLVQGLL